MIVKLAQNEVFWSLVDPRDIEKVGVILNSNAREVEIDYDKLQVWAKEQIVNSVKLKRVMTEPVAVLSQVEDVPQELDKTLVKKKVTKRKVTKKTKTQDK